MSKVYGRPNYEIPPIPAVTDDARYEAQRERVSKLDDGDTACLLDYIVGVHKADKSFVDLVEGWLNNLPPRPRPLSISELNDMAQRASDLANRTTDDRAKQNIKP